MSYDHFDEIIDRLYTSVKNRKQSLKLPSSVQVYDFKDSSTLDFWMQDYSIQNGSTFYEFESDESKVDYLSLRLEQNRQFAYQSALEGNVFASEKEYNSAMKKYQGALEMDENCTLAYIGRAEIMMNSQANAIQSLDVNLAVGIENSHTVDSSRLSIAISDIKKAIKLEPTNQNALRLYKELKLNSKRQAKQKSELENGEFLLPIGINAVEARKLNVFEAPRLFGIE